MLMLAAAEADNKNCTLAVLAWTAQEQVAAPSLVEGPSSARVVLRGQVEVVAALQEAVETFLLAPSGRQKDLPKSYCCTEDSYFLIHLLMVHMRLYSYHNDHLYAEAAEKDFVLLWADPNHLAHARSRSRLYWL